MLETETTRKFIGVKPITVPIVAGDHIIFKDVATNAARNAQMKVDKVEVNVEDGTKTLLVGSRYDLKTEDWFTDQTPMVNVVANLGKHPNSGKAYNVEIQTVHRMEETNLGRLYCYEDVDDIIVEDVKKACEKCYLAARDLYLDNLIPVVIHLKNFPKGTKKRPGRGTIQYRKNATTDLITLYGDFNKFKDEYGGHDMWCHFLFHELAHMVEKYTFDDEMRARWINLYHNYVEVKEIEEATVLKLQQDWIDSGSLESDMYEEDEVAAVKEIYKYISSYHKLKRADLTVLHTTNNEEGNTELADLIWPSKVDLMNQQMVVTGYAKKSWKEFLCEAFAVQFMKREEIKYSPELVEILGPLADENIDFPKEIFEELQFCVTRTTEVGKDGVERVL